jgi:hypothetical protein
MLYFHCFSTLLSDLPQEDPAEPGGTELKWDPSAVGPC